VVCGSIRRGTKGLFCSNFGRERGPGFDICRRVWCGECYKPHQTDNFHVFVPKDESGFEWRRKPKDALRFKTARDGDHLVTPFQCHLCHFQILTLRKPSESNHKDALLLCCLIRANLDALWSRESSTVDSNRRGMDQLIQTWKKTGIREHVLPPLGPHPTRDTFGMAAAVAMLVKSTQPGKHDPRYTQFETLRKLRAAYSNYYHASAISAETSMTLGRDTAKATLTTCPTKNMWFERFAKGCLKRMGQEVRQDLATSIHLMHALQRLLEREWEDSGEKERVNLAMIGAYIMIAFTGTFRGHEVFLVDTFGLLKYAREDHVERGERFVVVPLLGRYKTENTEGYHLTPLIARTNSGLEIERWVKRLAWVKERQGITHGPAFSHHRGEILDERWLELEILERIAVIQQERPDIVKPDVLVHEEYGISRSFRRGATTEARNVKVDEEDIKLMNRWRNFEEAKGRRPRMQMQDHYSDITQSIPSLLRFSKAL